MEKSAKNGNALVQATLGNWYIKSTIKKQNLQQGVYYLTLAAQQGLPIAQSSLGRLYQYGIGVNEDIKKAVSLYESAAAFSDPFALNSLGDLLYRGYYVNLDYAEALSLYKESVSQFNISPIFLLRTRYRIATMYKYGLGTEINEKKATYWGEKAIRDFQYYANQGNIKAQVALGLAYQQGLGVKKICGKRGIGRRLLLKKDLLKRFQD